MEPLQQLQEILRSYKKVAIAYSGGCDSHFLYHVAKMTLGKENVLAVLCVGDMMAKKDNIEAKKLLQDGQFVIKEVDVFAVDAFLHNQKDRCYACKKMIMSNVIEIAHQRGFHYVLDGKNKDDEGVYRPGIQACKELGILSPLAKVKMTKEMIRNYSRQLNISTYNKPSNSCLASRYPYNTLLTKEKLELVDQAESLFIQRGIFHVRVRIHDNLARIEVEKEDFLRVLEDKKLVEELELLGFDYVTLDLKGITSGSYDR